MTDLKEELNIYKERLEQAMEMGNIAWWEMDLPSGDVRFNESKAEMLNFPPERFQHYEDFTELVHPDDHDKAMKAMEDHLKGKKEIYEVEYRIRTKSGDYKWFKDKGGITERYDNGEPKKVAGIVIDISERKRLDEKQKELKEGLRNSVKRYRELLNTINDMIIIHDEDGKILEANEIAYNNLGYSKKEMFDKELFDLVKDSYAVKIDDRIRRIKKEKDLVFETKFINKDGEEIPVEVNSKKIRYKGKDAFLGVVRDITNRKRFKRREFYYSLLRQDIKNKLSNSTGYLQLIEGSNLTDRDKDFLFKSIEVNKLGMDIVKLAEHLQLTDEKGIEESDLRSTLKRAFEKCDKTLKREGAECEKNIDDIDCKVVAQSGFDLVLSTLVRTRVLIQDSKKLRLDVDEKEDEVMICIKDDGQKLSESVKEELTLGSYDGSTSGIGGPIYFALREIVKNYGGRTEFKDSPMDGSQFNIYLKKDV